MISHGSNPTSSFIEPQFALIRAFVSTGHSMIFSVKCFGFLESGIR